MREFYFADYEAIYELVYRTPRFQVFSALERSGKNIPTLSFSVETF